MAFDSAIHFLDELKDKYMHEVEKAIDDWDYQDFSPDKRTPLLDNEISGDAATDLAPETNALQQIKDASKLDWAGLSRDEMLANQAFGRMSISANTGASYESRVVAMATPAGGVQGIPDAAALQRFLQHASVMNPQALAEAFCARLQHATWQIRAKTLVLMEMLLESADLVGAYLPALRTNATLVQLLDKIRVQDHSAIARENARKVLSLVRSNGANTMLVAREHVAPKPHVRHAPVPKTKAAVVTKPKLAVKPSPSPTKLSQQSQTQQFHVTSPKIAAAALASWRRRSQKELLAGGSDTTAPKMNVVTASPPPAPVSPSSRTSSMTLQKAGSSRSGFSFVDQPAPQQPRMSITASRTQSFR